VISIGVLGNGDKAADYYLGRQAGCEMEYYTGAGERRGEWIGRGATALGLRGEFDEAAELVMRGLLAGCGADGAQVANPVLRADPRGKVPAAPLVEAIRQQAAAKGRPARDTLTEQGHLDAFDRLERQLARPGLAAAVQVRADVARDLATAAGLDPHHIYGVNGTDLLAEALPYAEQRVDVRRSGFDVTFSAPKSVSLLYGLGDAEVSEQVRQAHRAAIEQSLELLDGKVAIGRRGHEGPGQSATRVGTSGLIGAAFDHRSSRLGDPQLHTHVVVANLALGVDGRWGALSSTELFRWELAASYVYQAVLRGELTRRLGVTWSQVRRGIAEIDGIPAPVRRAFSRRRQQIEQALETVARTDARSAQLAALATRPAKTGADEQTLRDRWAARAAELGVDADLVGTVTGRSEPIDLPAADDVTERLAAPDGLTRGRSSFDVRDALRGVCEAITVGATVSLDDLRRLTQHLLHDPRTVPLLAGRGRSFSTTDLLALEQAAVSAVDDRRDAGVAVVPEHKVNRAIADTPLSTEQRQLVQSLTTSGAGVSVVVGPAGSGKTHALAAARQAWEAAGYKVVGAALAAIAARELQAGAGIPSRSLTRLFADMDRIDPQSGARAGLAPDTVLVIDEASMVGTRQLARLIQEVADTRTKLVLVGDPRQLPEIEAGGLFAALVEHGQPLRLDTNQRQTAAWERSALTQLRDGDVAAALDAYLARDRVHLSDTATALRERLVTDFINARRASGLDYGTAILTGRRGDAAALNRAVRRALLDAGELGTDEIVVGQGSTARSFRVGDTVLVTRNDYRRDLLNGTRGTVTAVDLRANSLDVRVPDQGTVRLPAGWLNTGVLDHAYALTCHRGQGITLETTLLYGTSALCREAGYVAMSRGRRANHIYAAVETMRRNLDPEIDHCPEQRASLLDIELDTALLTRMSTRRAQRLASNQEPDLTEQQRHLVDAGRERGLRLA
jgi:conjugative relaxase-like TrwC/TraI family protein